MKIVFLDAKTIGDDRGRENSKSVGVCDGSDMLGGDKCKNYQKIFFGAAQLLPIR